MCLQKTILQQKYILNKNIHERDKEKKEIAVTHEITKKKHNSIMEIKKSYKSVHKTDAEIFLWMEKGRKLNSTKIITKIFPKLKKKN